MMPIVVGPTANLGGMLYHQQRLARCVLWRIHPRRSTTHGTTPPVSVLHSLRSLVCRLKSTLYALMLRAVTVPTSRSRSTTSAMAHFVALSHRARDSCTTISFTPEQTLPWARISSRFRILLREVSIPLPTFCLITRSTTMGVSLLHLSLLHLSLLHHLLQIPTHLFRSLPSSFQR